MPLRIRVATWNLYLGADLSVLLGSTSGDTSEADLAEVQRQLQRTAFPTRAPTVAGMLVRERVDLIGLQEVCEWRVGDEVLWDYTGELLAALEELGEPYDVVVSQPTFGGSGEVERDGRPVTMHLEGRNAILRRRASPVQVEGTEAQLFGSALRTRLMGSVEISIDRGWCAARCCASDGSGSFTFVATHTEAYDAPARDQQHAELVAALPAGSPVVLVGDLNATPDEVGMPADLRDAWVVAGNPPAGAAAATCCQAADLTNPISQLSDRLDYIWVRGVAVESCLRLGGEPEDRTDQGLWPSDHAGVVATLVLD